MIHGLGGLLETLQEDELGKFHLFEGFQIFRKLVCVFWILEACFVFCVNQGEFDGPPIPDASCWAVDDNGDILEEIIFD